MAADDDAAAVLAAAGQPPAAAPPRASLSAPRLRARSLFDGVEWGGRAPADDDEVSRLVSSGFILAFLYCAQVAPAASLAEIQRATAERFRTRAAAAEAVVKHTLDELVQKFRVLLSHGDNLFGKVGWMKRCRTWRFVFLMVRPSPGCILRARTVRMADAPTRWRCCCFPLRTLRASGSPRTAWPPRCWPSGSSPATSRTSRSSPRRRRACARSSCSP